MTTIIHHPTWERDFIKGLRRRVAVVANIAVEKQKQKQKKQENNNNNNENNENENNDKQPYMIGLVGIPGSGKTTSGKILCDLLNKNDENDEKEEDDFCCVVLPMDGYHYSLEKLNSMKNPKDVIYRRGAPDTFDVIALKNDLHKIKYGHNCNDGRSSSTTIMDDDNDNDNDNDNNNMIVRIPGFDHAIGDPIPNAHIFDRNKHNIVIMEGLYLLLNNHQQDNDWNNNDVHALFDETIYIDIDLNICIKRLKKRNLCLPGYNTPEEIYERVDKVDRQNAIIVQKTKHRADTIVIGYNEDGDEGGDSGK